MCNDDVAVIDFMADLKNRMPIRQLDERLRESKNNFACVVTRHPEEDVITIFAAGMPFEYNDDGNILLLFYHKDMDVMVSYFERWIANIDYSETIRRIIIKGIIRLLNDIKVHGNREIKEAQPYRMG